MSKKKQLRIHPLYSNSKTNNKHRKNEVSACAGNHLPDKNELLKAARLPRPWQCQVKSIPMRSTIMDTLAAFCPDIEAPSQPLLSSIAAFLLDEESGDRLTDEIEAEIKAFIPILDTDKENFDNLRAALEGIKILMLEKNFSTEAELDGYLEEESAKVRQQMNFHTVSFDVFEMHDDPGFGEGIDLLNNLN